MKLFVTLAGLLAATDAYGYGYGYGRGIAGHYGGGVSYTQRSPQGLRGKRDADADAYGYAPVLRKAYPSWPGVVAPGFESTCYGCGLGKRSADAEAYGYGIAPIAPIAPLGRGIAAHPTGISYSNRSPQGAYGKRSADADAWGYAPLGYGYGRGIAAHPTGFSYTNRSPQGLGKRSADAWGYAPLGYGYGRGIAAHPTGSSFSNRSPQGLGKRSADADAWGYAPFGYGYGLNAGVNAHPTGISYSSVRLGKRDADAYGYGYAPVLRKAYPSWPGVVAPGFESTCYGCGLGKRSADAEADAFSYTQRSPQGLGAYRGYYGRGYYWG